MNQHSKILVSNLIMQNQDAGAITRFLTDTKKQGAGAITRLLTDTKKTSSIGSLFLVSVTESG